jgi:glycerol-3-phosphate dehydrogenase (NAD(P)+)
MKISVLGAGAWGTAISIVLSRRHEVTLWARDPALLDAMRAKRINQRYLPGFEIPAVLMLRGEITSALSNAELILIAVASNGLRDTLRLAKETGRSRPIIWLCKGFESERARLPHEVFAEELGDCARGGVLSGPSFAEEIARGLPAALTLASADSIVARDSAKALHSQTLRVYLSDDVTGVEVGGAVKNVMAIAAGISDGLALGFNARAALITRGLSEMTRLGVALGGRAETFRGLTGVGDLILTCTADLSRNRRVGLALARGERVEAILSNLGHTAEGVYTARAIARLADERSVDMPITRAVCQVLDDPGEARAAVQELLAREQKAEY